MQARSVVSTMVPPAYKKATRWWGIWLMFTLCGVLGLYLTVFTLMSSGLDRQLGFWLIAFAFVPLIVAVSLGLSVISRLNRKRIKAVLRRLSSLGFEVNEHPSETAKNDFSVTMAPLFLPLDLCTGPSGIQWYAVERVGKVSARIFEHRHMTGSGKSVKEHHHTVIIWPADHAEVRDKVLARGGWFCIAQYPGYQRRVLRKKELVRSEFADLEPRWSLFHDATAAARFLTPEVRLALQSSPKNECWCMGAGWMCLSFKGTLDAANIEFFMLHARRVLAGCAVS